MFIPHMRSCVCGGSNENCCWCSGSGYIREGQGAPRGWVATSSRLGRASRSARPRKNCPVCGVLVGRLQRHLNRVHNPSTAPAAQQNAPIEAPPAQAQRTTEAVPARPTLNRTSMKSCPLCNAQIREDRFQSHVSRRCPFRSRKALGPVAAATAKINKTLHRAGSPSTESLRYKEGAEIELPAWSNNLDATKNIGYPARESGRYGSHPSHDAFDDESEP
jgi:hypothetical protein